MRVGILGSGLMGGQLGALFARAGHEVTFAYARSPAKLNKLAAAAGAHARAGTPRDAAAGADALVVALRWSRLDDALGEAGDLAGKILVTCSLPMNDDDTALVIGGSDSGAEALARKRPTAKVVAAFNTVPSEALPGVYAARRRARRPSLVYCGDDAGAKKIAARLIADIGFAPVDAGPLRIARYAEPFALLVARLAYESGAGPELAYRFERFGA